MLSFGKHCLVVALALTAVSLFTSPALAQSNPLYSVKSTLREHTNQALQEKIFVHLDRPTYACGEIMWFKLYTVDGVLHQPLGMSKVAYVEVLDASQKPVLQGKVSLKEGFGNGSFVLPVNLSSGHYTLRAYTNWMKNFSREFFFEQPVTILNTFQPLGLKTNPDTASYAISFFPEGGNLVKGLPAKVAFKAVNSKTGKGIGCQGQVLDKGGKVVAQFEPLQFGIGQFSFTPGHLEEYVAVVKVPGGKEIRQKLPKVEEHGYNLLLEPEQSGVLHFTARSTSQNPEQIYLLGHTRQQVTVAATSIMSNGVASISISKDSLAEGITHFTLFNSQRQPLAERLFFTRPTKQLEIEVAMNKTRLGPREQAVVNLQTNSLADSAPLASLSMAVFRADSLQAADLADIKAYLWLGSDLKGKIENASAYLAASGMQADQALDNLMLTHGWSRFSWNDILHPTSTSYTYPYIPEFAGHFVKGKITHNQNGQPAVGVRTYLSSPGRNVKVYSSISNDKGEVFFEMKDFFGPKEVIMQTNFTKDSTYHFQILSPFSEIYSSATAPVFDLSETLKNSVYLRHLDVQAQNIYFEKYLNRFKPPGIDSVAFYGKPNEQYFLDDYTRFKVMEEVMREYVPGVMVRKRRDGFHFMVINKQRKQVFQEDPLVLLDGIPVFDIDQIMAFDPLKIQRLDVMTSRYFLGSLSSDGLVSYVTYKGDLAGFPLDPRALLQEYEGMQLQREFYAPAYETEAQKLSRLPDFRNLLYWSPDVQTGTEGKAQVPFFTSDLPGTYTIVIQGITNTGLPGSKLVTFEVRKPL